MSRLPIAGRTLALIGVIIPLLALFIYVAMRSGPLAPVPVTVAAVESRPISPALSGIGTVEARYTYKIGPTAAGRVKRVDVNVGDNVRAGQLLGEMDPVDLDDRVTAEDAALRRIEASVLSSEAQVRDAKARFEYAGSQARRYRELLERGSVAIVAAEAKEQELESAEAAFSAAGANLDAARQELVRMRAERAALGKQRANLKLISPVDGLVVARDADPGTTLVAGQPVIQIIDPGSLWVNARFNQLGSSGLAPGLTVRIILRSGSGRTLEGRVERVEPLADAVTEETLAKVTFDSASDAARAIGELAEVTVALPAVEAAPVVPNASIQRVDGKTGVWTIDDGDLRFLETKTGATDLDGLVQVTGLDAGTQVVVYSQKTLSLNSRVKIVEQIAGIKQ